MNAGKAGEIPVVDFASLAKEKTEGACVDWAEEGRSSTWDFCRYLKAHPAFTALSAKQLIKKLKSLTDYGEEELTIVAKEWDRVRYAKGMDPLDWAVAISQGSPLPDVTDRGIAMYARFISMVGHLQEITGAEAIYLPSRKVAEKLRLKSNRTVATMCAWAVEDGLLELVEKHTTNRAARYRFRSERFAQLRTRQ